MSGHLRSALNVCVLSAFVVLAFSGCGDRQAPSGSTGTSAGTGAVEATGEASAADYSHLSGTVKVNGSSSLFPVSEAAAEDFQEAANAKVKVTVGEEGTGSGFRKFLRAEIDICDASRPITTEEIAGAKEAGIEFIELPVCFDALTIAVHPSNRLDSITIAELNKMWEPAAQEHKIKRWNQVNPEWPDEELVLFGAGSSSGTFEYFTGAVTGKAKSSRGDYTASEDDNVLVQGVENNKNALGYFGFAYYVAHKDKMRAVEIINPKGQPVGPSIDNVNNGTYQPLSRPLFIYVRDTAAARPEVKEFIEFYLTKGADLAREVGYVPLPAASYQLTLKHFKEQKMGTVFGGVPEVGVTIENLLSREGKL